MQLPRIKRSHSCSRTDYFIGSISLAAGPVLSYYEFKHPMSDRLTDEAWQDLLDSPDKPERPKWYVPLMGTTPEDSE